MNSDPSQNEMWEDEKEDSILGQASEDESADSRDDEEREEE